MTKNSEIEIEYKLDKFGGVVFPPLHDSSMCGIRLLDKARAVLFFSTDEGDHFEVCLDGIRSIKLNDFREGNTVLDFSMMSGDEGSLRLVANLYEVDFESEKSKPYFQEIIDLLNSNQLKIIQLNPSYGCDLLALCKGVKVFKSV